MARISPFLSSLIVLGSILASSAALCLSTDVLSHTPALQGACIQLLEPAEHLIETTPVGKVARDSAVPFSAQELMPSSVDRDANDELEHAVHGRFWGHLHLDVARAQQRKPLPLVEAPHPRGCLHELVLAHLHPYRHDSEGALSKLEDRPAALPLACWTAWLTLLQSRPSPGTTHQPLCSVSK